MTDYQDTLTAGVWVDSDMVPTIEYAPLTFTDSVTVNATLLQYLLVQDTLSDGVVVDAQQIEALVAQGVLSDVVNITDVIQYAMDFRVTLHAGVAVSSAISHNATFMDVLSAGVIFDAVIEIDGLEYTAWVVNTRNLAVSAYAEYRFTSFAHFDGRYFGAYDGDLYELKGDTDAGGLITSLIKTGIMDFGTPFQKRVPRAYVGIRSDGETVFKTITNEEIVRWYRVQKSPVGLSNTRAKVSKGVKSTYWQFEFENIDGGDFELDSIRLMPVTLTRRIKKL